MHVDLNPNLLSMFSNMGKLLFFDTTELIPKTANFIKIRHTGDHTDK
jgi:hypothetical protein